jgi:acyl carrier protein
MQRWTPDTVADELERFIRHQFQVPDDDTNLTRETHLWEAGYVDSLGVAEVIAHLEETFGVRIPDEALFSPDFVRIRGIAQIVCDLRAKRPEILGRAS